MSDESCVAPLKCLHCYECGTLMGGAYSSVNEMDILCSSCWRLKGDGDWLNPKNQLTPLSRRDYFAAMAMQGLLAAVYSSKAMLHDFRSDNSPDSFRRYVTSRTAITRTALSYADALIKALDAREEGSDE